MSPNMRKQEKKTNSATLGWVFRTLIWPRKKLLVVGLLLIIVNRLSGLVLPGASKYVIDNAIAKGDMALLKILLAVVALAVL